MDIYQQRALLKVIKDKYPDTDKEQVDFIEDQSGGYTLIKRTPAVDAQGATTWDTVVQDASLSIDDSKVEKEQLKLIKEQHQSLKDEIDYLYVSKRDYGAAGVQMGMLFDDIEDLKAGKIASLDAGKFSTHNKKVKAQNPKGQKLPDDDYRVVNLKNFEKEYDAELKKIQGR